MEDDWDLQAVVRGCTTTSTATSCSSSTNITAATSATSTMRTNTCSGGAADVVYRSLCSSFGPQQDANFLCLQDLLVVPRSESSSAPVAAAAAGGIQELHDLYKPFFPKSSPPLSPQSMPISPLSVLGGLQDLSQQLQQQQQHQQKQQQQVLHQQIFKPKQSTLSIGGSHNRSSHTPSSRSKRRKNQMKRIMEVPAEALSSDMWSWRKYGQKPIKGSPYPRGYYRCSTSKGCLARKQVERNRSDPGMFIVTYTAEHNHPMPTHRNSLAGISRQKPATPPSSSSGDPNKPSSSPPVSPSASLSPAPDKLEIESSKEEIMEDEDDDINAPEMALDDDFFEGLEELADKSAEDWLSDHFPPQTMQLPWLANNATTAAADGG